MDEDQVDHDRVREQPQYAEDQAPLALSTYPAGDQDGALHIENDRTDPFQRDNIIERRGKVDVRCEHKDVVHGFFSNEVDDPCSLIVFEFQFSPNGLARRIKEAHVTIRFSAVHRDQTDPVVIDMYPQGYLSAYPTKQQETLVRGGSVTLGGGVAGLQIGGDLKAEREVKRDSEDATTVRGSIDLMGRNWGPKNAVSWTLLENQSTKTGVVRKLQAGVLLKRRGTMHFKATFTMKINANTTTKIGSIFVRNPKDDDVWYNPEREPPSTDRLQKYDINNLGTFELKSVSDITYVTLVENVEKRV